MFTCRTPGVPLAAAYQVIPGPLTTRGTTNTGRRGVFMVGRKRLVAGAAAAVVVAGTVAALNVGTAGAHPRLDWTSIPANTTGRGLAVPNQLSPELRQVIAAQGSQVLENPTALVRYYGYLNDGTLTPDP